VNPDTAQQWRYLQVALERKRATEKAPSWNRSTWLPRLAIASAAAAVVLIIFGVVWLRQPAMMTYETGRGQISTITLADSSQVTLSYTSELVIARRPLENVRRMSLHGEAYFRVRKTGEPFIVSTDVATVQVLGTEFNVRVRGVEMEVAVLTGRVQVGAQKDGKDSTVILEAGQITTCAQGDFPSTPGQLLFSEYPGWMHGKFLFYKTNLLSVCRDIEAKFDVAIRIQSPQLRDETITGAVDSRSVETALATLAGLTGTKCRYEGSGYILY